MDPEEKAAQEAGKREFKNFMDEQNKKKKKQIARIVVIKAIMFGIKIMLSAFLIFTLLSIVNLVAGEGGSNGYDGEYTDIASIEAGSIQERVWIALRMQGYSECAVAGAMGNIHYESGSFDPTKVEGGYNEYNGGIGICQWTNNNRGDTGRNSQLRDYAKSKGSEWTNEIIQVEFLVAELTVGGGADGYASYQLLDKRNYYGNDNAYADGWREATSIENATEAFCYSFERPNKSDAINSMDSRVSYAKQYYEQFKGTTYTSSNSGISGGYNENTVAGEKWLKGTITIDNKEFYIYNQVMDNNYEASLGLEDWSIRCNRAASICVTSGYAAKNKTDALKLMQKADDWSYIPAADWFSAYGLNMTYSVMNNDKEYDYRDNVRTALQSGRKILIYIRGAGYATVSYGGGGNPGKITGVGKSGTKWTGTWHYMAVLGYRKQDGREEMFIANSTNPASGWYGLDEFLVDGGREMANILIIK